MRRPFVPLAWFLATIGACTLAWSAVDQVAARVTDHTPVIGESSIRAALRASTKDPGATTPNAGTGLGSPDPSAPGAGAGSGAAGNAGNAGTGTDPGALGGSVGPRNTNGTKNTDPPGPEPGHSTPTTQPPPATTPTTQPPPPPPQNASVIVIGGSVTASCGSGTPNLISAIPANGFGTSVSRGAQLLVDFLSATHHSIVEAECEGAYVHWSTGEESAG